jgi:phage FluMu gp28-like protein
MPKAVAIPKAGAKAKPKRKARVLAARPVVDVANLDIKPPVVWRAFQSRFLNDPARFRLWVKAAQIGGSTTLASFGTIRCLQQPHHLVVVMSRSERQSKELSLKAKRFITELSGISAQLSTDYFKETSLQEHTIKFPNGSRIISVSATPETARGYTGDIILDEFAHHEKPNEVFTAAYRQVTLGYQMLIASTPNGQSGRFYDMANALGLANGQPKYQPVVKGSWSGHWTDIHLAIREGLPANADIIRAGCDEITWQQEYLALFIGTNLQWIPPELFEACVSPEATDGPPALGTGLYAGWDMGGGVGGDLSLIAFLAKYADVLCCKGMIDLSGAQTPQQINQARAWVPLLSRLCIDKTGMGITTYQTLVGESPHIVEGIDFGNTVKEAMAVQTKTLMEKRMLRLPNSDRFRRSFAALRRTITPTGLSRFDAQRSAEHGHCYDDQTEALTDSGWKFFRDLEMTDSVACLFDDERLVFHPPSELQAYDFTGDMVRVLNKQIDLKVTPNHLLYVRGLHRGAKFRKCLAAEALSYKQLEYKKDAVWERCSRPFMEIAGERVFTMPMMRFIGLWLAEGFTSTENRVGVTQQNILKDRFIMECVEQLPWKFHDEPNATCDSLRVKNKRLWDYFSILGRQPVRRIPRHLFEHSATELRELFDGMMHGDGSHQKGQLGAYFTTSPGLADDFQELVLRVGGMTANIYKITTFSKGSYSKLPQYAVRLSKRTTPRINKRRPEHTLESYKGRVYCCTVPSGVIYVRRNGKGCWCSNSDAWWATCLAVQAAGGVAGVTTAHTTAMFAPKGGTVFGDIGKALWGGKGGPI